MAKKKQQKEINVKAVLKKYNTPEDFKTYIEETFTTFKTLEVVYLVFLKAKQFTCAQVIFLQMKAIAIAESGAKKKEVKYT